MIASANPTANRIYNTFHTLYILSVVTGRRGILDLPVRVPDNSSQDSTRVDLYVLLHDVVIHVALACSTASCFPSNV